MVIEPAVMLILGIVFGSISISEKILTIAIRRGYFKKLHAFVFKNKRHIEDSIRSNQSIMLDDDIITEINETKWDEIRHVANDVIDLINISK